jgi:hypothetical protein
MEEVRILQDQVVLDPVVAPLFLFLARYVLQIMASLLAVVVVVAVAVGLILGIGMVVLAVEVVRFMVPPALVQHGQAQVQAGQVKHLQEHLLRAAQAEER